MVVSGLCQKIEKDYVIGVLDYFVINAFRRTGVPERFPGVLHSKLDSNQNKNLNNSLVESDLSGSFGSIKLDEVSRLV